MKTGLAALIHPHSILDFSSNGPLLIKHLDDSVLSLAKLPFLVSLDCLLHSWPNSIQAHLPDIRDEISSIDTNSRDAQKLFDNGMGLLFNEVQTISPLLQEWLHQIRLDLGLSAMTIGRCLVYATPDGRGTAAHFDQNLNFVLQIHGTKKWLLSPNKHVENPMTRHTMGTPTDPELMSYVNGPLPLEMPADTREYVLGPGSLLYVPRGYWHSTEAEGDALSLNFTFTAPTWIDLFSAALRSRLALSSEWRETANPRSEEEFDFLLSTLTQDLPNWRASDILAATESTDEGF